MMGRRAVGSGKSRWIAVILATGIALAAIAAPLVPSAPAPLTPAPTAQGTSALAGKKAAVPDTSTHPFWSELTEAQKKALAPLAGDWNQIESFRKKKWLEIGNRFGNMGTEEQARVQEKMREWAKLTPDERRVAREIYTRTRKLDASQKSAQWQEYQQLPEEEKKKLAADIAAKKRVANLPSTPASTKPAPKPFEKAVSEKALVEKSRSAPAVELSPLAAPSPTTAPTPATPAAASQTTSPKLP